MQICKLIQFDTEQFGAQISFCSGKNKSNWIMLHHSSTDHEVAPENIHIL
jgi:hypothetical protein